MSSFSGWAWVWLDHDLPICTVEKVNYKIYILEFLLLHIFLYSIIFGICNSRIFFNTLEITF